MATGPEHYQAAERLLEGTDQWDSTDPEHQPIIAEFLATAQAHAMLALAAATALSTAPGHEPYDYGEWRDATGTH